MVRPAASTTTLLVHRSFWISLHHILVNPFFKHQSSDVMLNIFTFHFIYKKSNVKFSFRSSFS